MFFALSARSALVLWLGACVALGVFFGWPVIAGSITAAVGPAYLSSRSRNHLIAFPFAIGGAVAGAAAFTGHGVIASMFICLLTGLVVGIGLSSAAMWLSLRLRLNGRSA